MSFNAAKLGVLAYANNFTLWQYDAVGTALSDLGEKGYFNNAAENLRVRDLIIIAAKDQVTFGMVTSNAQDNVVVYVPGAFGHPLGVEVEAAKTLPDPASENPAPPSGSVDTVTQQPASNPVPEMETAADAATNPDTASTNTDPTAEAA